MAATSAVAAGVIVENGTVTPGYIHRFALAG
jgi:hypothetical protein